MILAEAVEHGGVIAEYLRIMADPAHGLAENTWNLAEAGAGYLVGRKVWRRKHQQFDADHNIEHKEKK
jgi:hypothetical protein